MRPKTACLLFVLLSVLLVAACKEKTAVKSVDAGAATVKTADISSLPLPEQLDREAANRPKIAITAEKVMDALGAAGFSIIEQKQVLASPVNARFCKNAQIPSQSLKLVVCEYATPEAATKGREASLKKYNWQKNRETFINGAATLSVVSTRAMPSADEAGKKVIETFQKL